MTDKNRISKLRAETLNEPPSYRPGKVANSMTDLIGKTPVLKLNKLTANLKCKVLAKLEALNPEAA